MRLVASIRLWVCVCVCLSKLSRLCVYNHSAYMDNCADVVDPLLIIEGVE